MTIQGTIIVWMEQKACLGRFQGEERRLGIDYQEPRISLPRTAMFPLLDCKSAEGRLYLQYLSMQQCPAFGKYSINIFQNIMNEKASLPQEKPIKQLISFSYWHRHYS